MFRRKQRDPAGKQQAELHRQQQFRKLCQLCSPNFSREEVLAAEIDWSVIWKLALRHRVVPVMSDRIKQLAIPVPDEYAGLIAQNVQQNLYKGMKQAAELVRLTKLFEEHNIRFVVFKGIALLKLMGLELHQRHHGDIDILLADVADVWRADALLRSLGYQRLTLAKKLELNASQERHFRKYEKDVIYHHPQSSIQLELHFKLCLSAKLMPVPVVDFYHNRSLVKINGVSVPVMSQTDHQLYLLVHGAVSKWFRLKWLCDVPLASFNGSACNSCEFSEKTKKLGTGRMTTLGLSLAHELLAMPVSSEIIRYKNRSKKISRILKIVKTNIEQSAYDKKKFMGKVGFWVIFSMAYMPLLKKDMTYKLDHFRSYLTRTSDWEVLPLPAPLFFLYYPLRPFLWLKRQF